jgi:predicted acyltransferase
MPHEPVPAKTVHRLLSVDALRGFDMFWIIGADSLVAGLHKLSDWPVVTLAARQLQHAKWHGITFYDLIFPLFVYIMGVSIPLALGSRLAEPGNRRSLYLRIFRRALLLYLLGVFYYGGLANHWHEIRWVGVLQRIAACYFCGAIIFLNVRPRGQLALLAALLLGYWALMTWVPVPGFDLGDFSQEGNVAGYIDRLLLPGRAWYRQWGWDPEGLLSTLPAIGTCLLGVLTGELLRDERRTPQRKVGVLALAGALALALGYLWGTWFPINKKMWTSSYVLVAGGYSCLFLAAFYQLIDIWQWRRWCLPFVIIGSNAIFIYMASELIPFDQISLRFVGGDVAEHLGRLSGVVAATVQLGLELAILWWLYTKKIFIRI